MAREYLLQEEDLGPQMLVGLKGVFETVFLLLFTVYK